MLRDAIPVSVRIRQEWVGFQELVGVLGWSRALRVGMRMKSRIRQGEPWEKLQPPEDRAEQWSREQIAPAIVLYNELRREGIPNPFDAVQRVVVRAAVPWMRHAIGPVSQKHVEELQPEHRRAWFTLKIMPFLNMEVGRVEIESKRVSFEVKRCFFPRLCKDAGVPELAPVFCQVDSYFFGDVQSEIDLHRPSTLASGDASCEFNLQFRMKPKE